MSRISNALAARLMQYGSWIPDGLYIRFLYRLKMGNWPNLRHPCTFTEKLQWLKLHNRNSEYTKMVDKYAVKDYVSQIIGAEYVIPTLGVWDRPEHIEWETLPNKFVLKTTHGGGGCGIVICKDKESFDKQKAIDRLNRSLKQDIYLSYREWPYKDVPKRILAEAFIETHPETENLRDYKFFCFNGEVKMFKIDFDRFIEHHANYYSEKGKLLPFGEKDFSPVSERILEMPSQLEKMILFAEKLSKGCPFLRVDFYENNHKLYFGELTFYPASGMGEFQPLEWDRKIGGFLCLHNK